MSNRFPYSQQAIDWLLNVHYPKLTGVQAATKLKTLAQDFFCGTVALERTDYLALRTALHDINTTGTLNPVDHKTYLAATDQDDHVIDNLTKEERYLAICLADFARKQLISPERIGIDVGPVFSFTTSGYDDCFTVLADASVNFADQTLPGYFSATFDQDINLIKIGCYNRDNAGENQLAHIDDKGKQAVAAERADLIDRHGIDFTPALTI
jgi:hypothetical protein